MVGSSVETDLRVTTSRSQISGRAVTLSVTCCATPPKVPTEINTARSDFTCGTVHAQMGNRREEGLMFSSCIVANRPGMAGTVPEFWALSRWYPGCPGIYAHLALRLSLAYMAAAVSIVSSSVLFDTHKATKAVRRHFLADKNFRPTILAPACDPTTLFARTWKFSTMRVSW